MFHAQLSSAAARTSARRAVVLGVVLAAGALGAVSRPSNAASGSYPRFWGWNGPKNVNNPNNPQNPAYCWAPLHNKNNIFAMVKVPLYNSETALQNNAERAADDVADIIQNDSRYTDFDDTVGIMMYGFGQGNWPTSSLNAPALYFHASDLLTAAPSAPVSAGGPCTVSAPSALTSAQARLRPWFANGISETSDWVGYFTSRLKTNLGAGVSPKRFVFDTEAPTVSHNTTNGSSDDLLAFESAINDTRFDSIPPAGWGSTLRNLFNAQWGYYPVAGPSNQSRPYYWCKPLESDYCCPALNRDFSNWLIGLHIQAQDGAVASSTSGLVNSSGWPGAKRSNYITSCRIDGSGGRYYEELGVSGRYWAKHASSGGLELQAPVLYDPEPTSSCSSETCLRELFHDYGRRLLEACIESYGGGHEHDISPWIMMPKTSAGNPGISAHGFYPDANDARRQLAMLRSKDIQEMIVFNGDLSADNSCAVWSAFDKLVSQVWGFDLTSASVDLGTRVGSSPPTVVDTLKFALKDRLQVTDSAGYARVTATFNTNSMWQGAATDRLGIVVESTASVSWVWCTIEAKKQDGSGAWVTIGSYTADTTGNGQHRVIAVPSTYNFISSGGAVQVRVTHLADSNFTSYFDLIQVVGLDSGSSFLTAPPKPRGVNGIATVLANFGNAGGEENPADINNDGVIDAKDIEALIGPASYLPNN